MKSTSYFTGEAKPNVIRSVTGVGINRKEMHEILLKRCKEKRLNC